MNTKNHIISVASNLFYQHGIRAVGVDQIVEVAEVAKATLYRHFPSKDDLVASYLQARHEAVLESFKPLLDQSFASGAEAIEACFNLLHRKAGNATFRGCAFLHAVSEFSESVEVHDIARAHKLAVRDIFARILASYGLNKALADAVSLLYDGALAAIAVRRDAEAALLAGRLAQQLIADDAASRGRVPSG